MGLSNGATIHLVNIMNLAGETEVTATDTQMQ